MSFVPTYNHWQPELGQRYSQMAAFWVINEPQVKRPPRFTFIHRFTDKIVTLFSIRKLIQELNTITEFANGIVNNFDNTWAKYGHDELVKRHTSTKQILDSIYALKIDRIKPSPKNEELFNALNAFIDVAKQLEMKLRIAAYPERNYIPFTYDEMREMKEAMKDWEPAEEQNDIYVPNK